MAQTYTESLLNDGSAFDGYSYNQYRVLTLTAYSYNLHHTVIPTTNKRCGDSKMNHSGDKL